MASLTAALNWIGLGKESAKAAQDHSRLNFSDGLIASLKDDHAELLKMYTDVEQMALSGRYANIPAALAVFKTRFDLHILNENLHFYCYIEEKLAGSAENQALIKSFRGEMNAIARGVVNFIKKYRMSGVRPSNGAAFLAELREVGALLVQRITREEHDLYTLYQP
jgi:hypothetical protein